MQHSPGGLSTTCSIAGEVLLGNHLIMRLPTRLVLAVFLLFNQPRVFGAELRPDTLRGFERYVRAAKARVQRDRLRRGDFLYIESLPSSDRQTVRAQLHQGNIYVIRLTTRNDKGNPIRTPNGWIHHWLAAMFIPGATLGRVVAVDQDYDKYTSFYKPEMVRSRVLEHESNTFKVYARLQKKTPWVTVTLDTYNNVRYLFVDAQHLYTESLSYRIQQVNNAGKPDEHIDPPGHGSGFLWAIDVFWRYEATSGGIMVESETIALTRTAPFGLGWIIKPFVRRAAAETAKQMMIRTRGVILQEKQKSAEAARREKSNALARRGFRAVAFSGRRSTLVEGAK